MNKAIIIGATSGIGKELARLLAGHCARIGITGRRAELLEALRGELPETFISKVFDVTDTKQTITSLEELAVELGGMDLLVISAGTGDLNGALDFGPEKRAIDTNVTGFTCIAGWAFNYFAKQGSGHLVAISSVGGLRGSREAPAYNASKAYQINYLEGLRQKAVRMKSPVRVTDIRPGLVDTAMAKGEGLFWVAPVEKAARLMLKGILRGKGVVYVTRRWRIIAGILQAMPGFIYRRL